jgi:capsular polysaccharide biosynthesis protein
VERRVRIGKILALEVVISVDRSSRGQQSAKSGSERRLPKEQGQDADASRDATVASNGFGNDAAEVRTKAPRSAVRSPRTIAPQPEPPTGTDETAVPGHTDAWGLSPQSYESPGRSLRTHWKVATLIVALAVVAGIAVIAVKTPTYTAETRLIVGKTVNLNNIAATPGLSVAGTELAVTYSRLLSTPSVITDAEKQAGSAGAGGSVAASPIPQSPIIRVEGTGQSAAIAMAQANAGAKALIKAVGDVNAAQQAFVDDLLRKYEEASLRIVQDQRDLDRATTQLRNNPTNAQFEEEVAKAQTKLDTDVLVRNNLSTQYDETASPEQVNAQIIQQLGPAEDTGNDRKSVAMMVLLVAVVVGALGALAITVLIDKRKSRGSPVSGRPALDAAPSE